MPRETTSNASDAQPESERQRSLSARGQRIRYRPMLLNAALSVVTLVLFWTWPHLTGSTRVIATASVIGVSSVWFAIWLAFGSRIARRPRCILLASLAACVLLAVSLLRIRAYTGDLIPILTWRWSTQSSFEQLVVGERPTDDAPARCIMIATSLPFPLVSTGCEPVEVNISCPFTSTRARTAYELF